MEYSNSETSPETPKALSVLSVLLILAGFVIVGSALSPVILAIFGIELTDITNAISSTTFNRQNQMLIIAVQIIAATLSYIIFPLLYIFFFKPDLKKVFKAPSRNFLVYAALALLLVFAIMPFISWLAEMNQAIKLPASLKGVEDWMRESESQAERVMKNIIFYTSTIDFFIILFVIAVLPAIGEELLFRGLVQNELLKALKNPHVAIFLTGFLFSFIHFQFYGFFPRMLLGVVFGYFYYWSGNLWVPIIMHFVFNGFNYILMNLNHSGTLELDVENMSVPFWLVVVSVLLSGIIVFYFRKTALYSNQVG